MQTERLSQSLRDTVHALAVEIGPRPSASEAEGRAAGYVAERLQTAGFRTAIEPFAGLPSFSLTYGILYAAFVIAASLIGPAPTAAFALACLAFVAFILENGACEVVSRLLPKLPSRNVVGVRPPAGDARRRVVLTCHLDSANAALLWHPSLVSGFRRSFVAMVAAMGAVVALAGWASFAPPLPPLAQAVLWVAAAYLLGSALLLAHRQWRMPCVPGANDDASGVAAVLAAVEGLGELEHTEVWAVATGCEESGLIGMARFCDAHALDRESTYFINLDNCGAGRVAYTTHEGMLRRVGCDPHLAATAQRAADEEPRLGAEGRPFHTMNNDSFVLLRRGYRALSIMAFDARGNLPHWHWPTDTAENIDEATIECAAELARRMVHLLDREAQA